MTWQDRIALRRWWASGNTVAAGDAVRMQFAWQRLDVLKDPALTALTLVGADGSVWAQRVAVPCNGRCETTGGRRGSCSIGWHSMCRRRAAGQLPVADCLAHSRR